MTQENLVVFNDGKQPRNPHWFAMVKNTEKGREWIKNFRKKNPHLKVSCRARHSDRKYVYEILRGESYTYSYPEHVIRVKEAERFAVYVDKKYRGIKDVKIGDEFRPFQYKGYQFGYSRITDIQGSTDIQGCAVFSHPYGYHKVTNKAIHPIIIFRWSENKNCWMPSKKIG